MPEDVLFIYFNAVLPYVVLFAPWSRITRFSLLTFLLAVDWFSWMFVTYQLAMWTPFVPTLACSTFAICGILWLHGYRICRDCSMADAHSLVEAGLTAEE